LWLSHPRKPEATIHSKSSLIRRPRHTLPPPWRRSSWENHRRSRETGSQPTCI